MAMPHDESWTGESWTGAVGPPPAVDPQRLRAHIAQLEETLQAIRSAGIDSVIVGPPGAEQIHPVMGADRRTGRSWKRWARAPRPSPSMGSSCT